MLIQPLLIYYIYVIYGLIYLNADKVMIVRLKIKFSPAWLCTTRLPGKADVVCYDIITFQPCTRLLCFFHAGANDVP